MFYKLKLKGLSNSLFVLLLVAMLMAGYYSGQFFNQAKSDVKLNQGQRYKVALRGDEPQIGDQDAPITIIIYSNFECAFCRSAVPEVLEIAHNDSNNIRLIYKHFPFKNQASAKKAAKAAWAAHQQKKFWLLHDWLMQNNIAEPDLGDYLRIHKFNINQFEIDRISTLADTQIESDIISAKKLNIRAVPSFIVNGHIYTGVYNKQQWRKIIEYELAIRSKVTG